MKKTGLNSHYTFLFNWEVLLSKEIDKNANEMLTSDERINTAEEHMKSHNWKIIIADDDDDVHVLTKIVLEDYDFAGQKIEFLDAYSGEETISLLKENPDTALILLDVVMETEDAGLNTVIDIREKLKNKNVRIVLRTGHPGKAPESKIIMKYDINDYKEKTELTIQKLFTTITSSLRAYRELYTKDLLLKEVHHRVRNNLQLLSSIINLRINSTEDKNILKFLKEYQNQINSMALVHKKVYQNNDIAYLEIKEYIYSLVRSIFQSYNIKDDRISLRLDIDNLYIEPDIAIPFGIIINELISNTLKYAFPGKEKGHIYIKLEKIEEGTYTFIISDNGIGLPENIDFNNIHSMGLKMVNLLVNQIGGIISIDRDNGTKYIITFKHNNII